LEVVLLAAPDLKAVQVVLDLKDILGYKVFLVLQVTVVLVVILVIKDVLVQIMVFLVLV
jgi:hypothetical protein